MRLLSAVLGLIAFSNGLAAEADKGSGGPGEWPTRFLSEIDREAVEGFAAKATGGEGGEECVVTSLADSGPGSLRDCAESEGPKMITFDVSGKITLQSSIHPKSDKTIDGTGADITVGMGVTATGFEIFGADNIIIRNIKLIGGPAAMRIPPSGPANYQRTPRADAININGGSSKIWIDHITFTQWGDKCIGIPQGTDITISWNHVYESRFMVLIGTDSTRSATANTRVTLHHNFSENVGERSPDFTNLAHGHVYNNYIKHFGTGSFGFGTGCIRQAVCLIEGNIYEPKSGGTKRAIKASSDIGGPGNCKAVGNLMLDGARSECSGNGFTPDYDYELDESTKGLAEEIEENAGWQG